MGFFFFFPPWVVFGPHGKEKARFKWTHTHRLVPPLEVLFLCFSPLLLLLSSPFHLCGGRSKRLGGDNLGRDAVTALGASAVANTM